MATKEHEDARRALEAAEERYLIAAGWKTIQGGGLWVHPRDDRAHIARVAAYKQRQIDAAEENRRRNDR